MPGDRVNIAIVASGPSAAGLELPPHVRVIAVNGAIDWIDRANYWFTLDPSANNMARMRRRRPGTQYVAAVDETCPVPPEHVTVLRRLRSHGQEPKEPRTAEWWFWRLGCKSGLSLDPGSIHTGNSAYGALGLAFHMNPRKIALFGVDGTAERRVEGGWPAALPHLPLLFSTAKRQLDDAGIGVVNGSVDSRIDCFTRTLRETALRWIAE